MNLSVYDYLSPCLIIPNSIYIAPRLKVVRPCICVHPIPRKRQKQKENKANKKILRVIPRFRPRLNDGKEENLLTKTTHSSFLLTLGKNPFYGSRKSL